MINLNKKDSLASKVEEILHQEALKGNQKKIDKNHNNKIDAQDFKILRGEKKVAEEIDVKDKTEDTLAGRKKVEKKDDVGPNSNFKSSKVRFHAGPDNTDDSETVIPADTNKASMNKKLKMGESTLTLKKFKEQHEEHSIYDQMIQEVLSKDASAGDWIHDFVHSDNPKFAGKSKEKRKQMALAAYYAKQRNEEVESDICPDCMQDPCVCGGNHVEESVEQIDELSKSTLGKYYQAAKQDNKDYADSRKSGDPEEQKWAKNRYMKRSVGMVDAKKRLAKEDVEQIDELSKSTLGSYVKSAARDVGASRKLSADFQNQADKARKPSAKAASSSLSKKFMATAQKRHAGIGKAVERLTKEETEQVEEGWDDMLKSVKDRAKPQPSGGSGVKGGTRYGGSKQKDKPEHDDKKKVEESKRPETDNVPFEGPYNSTSKPVTVTDKSGAKHTPMSRVKHLARQAMKKVKNEMLGKTGTSE